MMFLYLLYVVALIPSPSWCLSFANIFGDGIVLQSAPYRSQVWGSLNGINNEVSLVLNCPTLSEVYQAELSNNEWLVTLNEVQDGSICTIEVNQEGQPSLSLREINFGDVWVCSGQSNMEWTMNKILNATEEINDIANYGNIRMIRLQLVTSDVPLAEVTTDSKKWFGTAESDNVREFSAICLLFAKEISNKYEGNKVFGLIESNWGGTRIEPWSTPEGLSTCQVPPHPEDAPEQSRNSNIFNAMIHPLLKFTIKGVLWYQGESNRGWNKDLYSCTFPTLISEWRRLWSAGSKTNPEFPFGFVQLAAYRQNYAGAEFPTIRWHQSADIGYVPNSLMPDVFMAVSLDTFDAESGIHPRNKQLVAKRLAIAGLNVAYGFSDQPTNGPFPTSVLFTSDSGLTIVEIIYDQDFIYELKESNGFYICCETSYDLCDKNSAWEQVSTEVFYDFDLRILVVPIDSCATGFAYLWNETPVLGTEALPIYSTNEAHLPAAPWKKPVIFK